MQQKRRRILRLLARGGGRSSPGEIHAELGIPARTVSRILKRLRAKGVISGTERHTPQGVLSMPAFGLVPVGHVWLSEPYE